MCQHSQRNLVNGNINTKFELEVLDLKNKDVTRSINPGKLSPCVIAPLTLLLCVGPGKQIGEDAAGGGRGGEDQAGDEVKDFWNRQIITSNWEQVESEVRRLVDRW